MNRIEMLNELLFCYMCFFLVGFTIAIEDGEIKLDYGWIIIGILTLIFVFNSWFMIYDMFYRITLLKTKIVNYRADIAAKKIHCDEEKCIFKECQAVKTVLRNQIVEAIAPKYLQPL